MEPRSKIERRCWELSKRLPQPTEEQYIWAKRVFGQNAYFYKKKDISGTFRCTECGNEWDGFGSNTVVCPKCGETLNVTACRKKKLNKYGYYVVVSEIDEFIVFRYYWFDHNCLLDGSVSTVNEEVMQLWYNDKDKEVVIAKDKGSFGWYRRNVFNMFTNMTIKRPKPSYSGDIRWLDYKHLYTAKIPQMFNYVDWSELDREDVDVVRMMRYFRRYPIVETLIKAGCYKVAIGMISKGCFESKNVNVYINAARLGVKNKYFNENINIRTWIDMIDNIIELGKDWHNPVIVLPENLEKTHTMYSMKIQRMKAEAERKRDLKKNMQMNALYTKMRECFFGLEFVDGDIHIRVLRSVDDFFIEGGEMRHCVYANRYYDMERNKNSLILSARKGNDWDKPEKFLETIEVNLMTFEIIQSRGHCNQSTEFHDRILKLVNAQMSEIKNICRKSINNNVASVVA